MSVDEKNIASVDNGHVLSRRRDFEEFKSTAHADLLAQKDQVLKQYAEVDETAEWRSQPPVMASSSENISIVAP